MDSQARAAGQALPAMVVSQTSSTIAHKCSEMMVPGPRYWNADAQARLRAESMDPRKLAEAPCTKRSWIRLILGLDHTHNLKVHLKVHAIQDVLIIILGAIFGYILFKALYATEWDEQDQKDIIYVICYPGILYLNLIGMIIQPLMFTAISTGVASVMTSQGSQRGFRTGILFVLGTNVIAITIALLVASWLEPGGVAPSDYLRKKVDARSKVNVQEIEQTPLQHTMAALDNLIPSNILASVASGNMLGLCSFSILFGIAASTLDNNQILQWLENLNQLLITMLPYRSQPFAIFFLVAKVAATHAKDFLNIFKALRLFVGGVTLALALQFFLVLPAIYYGVTRRNPFKWMRDMEAPLFVAFCTCSSAATMPYTLHAVATNWPRMSTARVVIPIGAQLNMNGTSIYQAAIVMYIAQVSGHPLSMGQCFLVAFFTLISSVTTPAIPGASLVTVTYVLRACASDSTLESRWVESTALLLPVDKIVDMLRTVVNVFGDTIACAVVDTRRKGMDSSFDEAVGFMRKDISEDSEDYHLENGTSHRNHDQNGHMKPALVQCKGEDLNDKRGTDAKQDSVSRPQDSWSLTLSPVAE